ncbi:MAG: M20/M25/M40 family metallo-hydrolase, partial [Bacteroidales bacterium]|nr:M20/M25/M40 family metallo-hydrolase [Bacteroidales bacterium]
MRHLLFSTVFILTGLWSFSQNTTVTHFLNAKVNPETSTISVRDSLIIPENTKKEFWLNADLLPISEVKNISLKKLQNDEKSGDVGMDRDDADGEHGVKLSKWQITGSGKNIVISYSGKIASEIAQSKENYQRGFSQSPGIICAKGVYLAGSTYWVPTFKDKLMSFSLTTELPKDWKNVTIGKRTNEETKADKHSDTWVCDKPQEEVFLIAAHFYEYSYDMNNGVKAMAFLRSPDEGLANKYLEVTEQYMNMDNEMLGKYPYSKFALVENFWETGYGMPSFTLLGEKIIRFPFILHSSYPHELLHNWWGNSVFVNFDGGNWCEGTTAFMADHLIKEQRGAGEEYRRSTLQKFSNLVNKENDFPLNKFVGRYDGPSEAIGYGKALMMWQMLRRKLGDKTFLKGMRLFYKNNKFRAASYADIRKAMEEVSGISLEAFFNQWVNRTGAPELAIKTVKTDLYGGKYRVNITLEQIQPYDVFNIDVPINVGTEKGIESFVFNMDKKEQDFQISLNSKPLKLAVDPQYDIFRILNPNEVPPTLSKIWGSKDNLIILPSNATKEQLTVYQKFANEWKAADNDNFEITFDKDLKQLPKDKTAWIIGFNNKFVTGINQQLSANKSGIEADSVNFDGKKISKKGNGFIFTLFDKNDINKQTIFIGFDNEKAIPGFIRKLPHYGKYSYLAFTGDEPTNIAKGQWAVLHSPLVKIFDKSGEKILLITPRKALGTLKPVFSEKRMMATIKYLSSDELKGRGLGTPELEKTTEYIAGKFKDAGLQPLNGSYLQKFTHTFKDKGELKLTNVIGIIQGTDATLKDEPVIVSAHYDHLGFGWPDVHKGNEGKIHPGADDNASGIAILIELAKTMAKTAKPKRTIVFIACSGEEAGLIGSRYFVAHRKDYFKGEIFADVNLDTDGSLFDKKLMVLNGNTAKEWKFIFMGTDYTTGIKSEVINKQLDASDQFAFIEQGIPAVQLFTGATENYHRPTDIYDKIDGKGLVKVATVAKEVVEYLGDREDPMSFTGDTEKGTRPAPGEKKNRRVSTGSVPAFDYTGTGIKIGAIVSDSPAEKAGLKTGDIIVALDGEKTDD